MPTPIKVMLVDDHAIVRDGLQEVLDAADDIEVVGQASDGVEAVETVAELAPDVVIMDVIMPNKDGVEACREVMDIFPDTRVLVLTAATEDDAIINAVAAGASGYLQKFSGREDLLTAVREVAEGKSRIPVDVVRQAFHTIRSAPAPTGTGKPATLTEREQRILRLFSQGNSYAEVGKVTGNSPITIRNTIYRIENKLGVKSKQEIVVWAARNGVLDEEEPED